MRTAQKDLRAFRASSIELSWAHLEFRRVPLDGSNNACADHKALVSGHGELWLCVWSPVTDLVHWPLRSDSSGNRLQLIYLQKAQGRGGGSQQRGTRGGGAKDARYPAVTEVWPDLVFQEAEPEKKNHTAIREGREARHWESWFYAIVPLSQLLSRRMSHLNLLPVPPVMTALLKTIKKTHFRPVEQSAN